MQKLQTGKRPLSFYALSVFFVLFVLFLYGPMSAIYILSFQGPSGGLTFPMRGWSLHWFDALFSQQRTGDFAGAFTRSMILAAMVLLLTVAISVVAGLIMPGLLVGLGVGLTFQTLGVQTKWFASALVAQLTWTLPFGMLIMFAVFSRFNRAYEEAARDLGATNWQIFLWVVLPILFPGMIAVALFGFTLSYDEFPRTLLTSGAANTLPMEIWGMTTNVTSPALYALGTVTTLVSFIAIALALGSIALIQWRRSRPVGNVSLAKEQE